MPGVNDPDNVVDTEFRLELPSIYEIEGVTDAMTDYADAEERIARITASSVGPFQALERAKNRLRIAEERGTSNANRLRDLKYQERVAQERVDRITGANDRATVELPGLAGGGAGPRGRLSQLQQRMEVEKSQGASQDRLADIADQIKRTQTTVEKANAADTPSTLSSRIASVLYSARIMGPGGGIAPLLGKGIDAIGGAGMGAEVLSNPYVLAGAAALKLASILKDVAEDAAESGREFTAIHYSSGSNQLETGQLSSINKAFGVDLAAMARSMNERITTDSMAMAFASQFGAYNIAGPFGKVDQSTDLLKVIRGLRDMPDEHERIRTARLLGIEGALPLTKVSAGTFAKVENDALTTSNIMNPAFQQQSAEFGVAANRVKTGWENMMAALSEKFFPVIIPILNSVAEGEETIAAAMNGDIIQTLKHGGNAFIDAAQSAANVGSKIPGAPGNLISQISDILIPGFGTGAGLRGFSGGAEETAANPVNANTEELRKNTIGLAKLTSAVGGGERARSVEGNPCGGYGLNRAIEQGVARHGPL